MDEQRMLALQIHKRIVGANGGEKKRERERNRDRLETGENV